CKRGNQNQIKLKEAGPATIAGPVMFSPQFSAPSAPPRLRASAPPRLRVRLLLSLAVRRNPSVQLRVADEVQRRQRPALAVHHQPEDVGPLPREDDPVQRP